MAFNDKLPESDESFILHDYNGNTCGTVQLVSNLEPTFLGDVAQELHTLANGGLDKAARKATIGQIKTRVREIRDSIYNHIEKVTP